MAFTSAEEIRTLLGLDPSISFSDTFLGLCDRYVEVKMYGRNIEIPAEPDIYMKQCGAFIGCAFYVDSTESKHSFFDSVSYAGGSFRMGDLARQWERRAERVIDAMSTGIDLTIEAITYFDDPTCPATTRGVNTDQHITPIE